MKKKLAACILTLLCIACRNDTATPATTTPTQAVSVPPTTILPATYAPDAGATENVRNECTLERTIANYIVEATPGSAVGEPGAQGRVLSVQIVTVIGAGGGAWSGAKTLEVTGTLTENGTTLGTFRARRSTSGGAFGGYKGTCTLLHRDAKTLGEDISTWLAAPTMDARLGEL